MLVQDLCQIERQLILQDAPLPNEPDEIEAVERADKSIAENEIIPHNAIKRDEIIQVRSVFCHFGLFLCPAWAQANR